MGEFLSASVNLVNPVNPVKRKVSRYENRNAYDKRP